MGKKFYKIEDKNKNKTSKMEIILSLLAIMLSFRSSNLLLKQEEETIDVFSYPISLDASVKLFSMRSNSPNLIYEI